MKTYVEYEHGWSVIGEEDHSFLAVASGPEQDISPNMVWDIGTEEAGPTREADFAEILEFLTEGTEVETDTVSGFVVSVPEEFDVTLEGNGRGIYKLLPEEAVYYANGDTAQEVIDLMTNYTQVEGS